jgi:serine/threonine-protein kinase
MGHVYLAAMDASTLGGGGRAVVKILQPELAAQQEMRSMFLHEARLGSLLDHPAIARIHDYGEHDEVLYLAMEYVDGLPLSRIMRRRDGNIPLGAALRIVADVAGALGHAHAARDPTGEPLEIVHRDVTPQNVLLSKGGQVKLIDFGVAKSAGQDHRTRTGVLKGKLSYMAPEQFRGHTCNQTDIFALGVVLHELVSGQRLFRRPTEAETFAAILNEPLPPLKTQPDVSEVLEPIVQRALARELEDRYGDATHFEADLREAMRRLGTECTAEQLSELAHTPRPEGKDSSQHPSAPPAARASHASGLRVREGEPDPSPQSLQQPVASSDSDSWRSDAGFGDLDDEPPDGETHFDPRVMEESATADGSSEPAPIPAPSGHTPEQAAHTTQEPDEVHAEPTGRPAPERNRGNRRMPVRIGVALAAVAGLTLGVFWLVQDGEQAPSKPARLNPIATEPAGEQAGPSQPANKTAEAHQEGKSQGKDEGQGKDEREGQGQGKDPNEDEPEPAANGAEAATETASGATGDESTQAARVPSESDSAPDPKAEAPSAQRQPDRRRRRQAAAAPKGSGKLFLNTDPWTFVRLGPRSLGQTPLVDVELPAGRHTLRLREGNGETHRIRVRIRPNEATKKFLELQ